MTRGESVIASEPRHKSNASECYMNEPVHVNLNRHVTIMSTVTVPKLPAWLRRVHGAIKRGLLVLGFHRVTIIMTKRTNHTYSNDDIISMQ